MLCKKYLKQTLFLIRSIGFAAVFPIIVVYICLPFFSFCIYQKYGIGYELWEVIIKLTQLFLPFFSIWWMILSLRDFVESNGNEILFINNKHIMRISMWTFVFYSVSLIPLYLIYSFAFENMWFEFVRIMVECILFNSAAYILLITSQSSAISFAVLIIYTILSFFKFDAENRFLYIDIKEMTLELFWYKYFPFLVFSAILLIIARIIGIKRIRFK